MIPAGYILINFTETSYVEKIKVSIIEDNRVIRENVNKLFLFDPVKRILVKSITNTAIKNKLFYFCQVEVNRAWMLEMHCWLMNPK